MAAPLGSHIPDRLAGRGLRGSIDPTRARLCAAGGAMERADLARYVDHTLLKPEATPADIEKHIAEAAELGVFSICISPSLLPVTVPEWLLVATVCGFPSGKHA